MTDSIGLFSHGEQSRASRDDEAMSILTIATQPPAYCPLCKTGNVGE